MNIPLDEERMHNLKKRLLEEKREIEARVSRNDHYQLSESFRDSLDDLSMNDNHPGDLGTEMFERSKDNALLEREAFRLTRVEDALARMDSGEYGRCKLCGAFISAERLEALPTADHCAEHEPQQNPSDNRPVEEQFLWPPFGRTSLDERDSTAFDGEDAWQQVAAVGTSNSPAMAEDNEVHDYDTMYIEADENQGYVEPIENFLATDITGKHVTVVRSRTYRQYMNADEGEPLLEPDQYYDGQSSSTFIDSNG